MGWLEDLQDLLGTAKDETWNNLYTSDSLPINEIATGDWGGAATAPISAAFNFMEIPLNVVKENVGHTLAFPDLIRAGTPFEDEGVRAAVERQREAGGRAEWENFIQDKPWYVKAPLELGLDPTTYLGLPVAKQGVKALRGLEALGEAGNATRGLATLGEAGIFAFNDAPIMAAQRIGRTPVINNPLTRGAVNAGKAGLSKIVNNPFAYDTATQVRQRAGNYGRAFDELLSAKNLPSPRLLPSPVRGGTKSLAPIDDYDVPPFLDTAFDGDAGRAIKAKAGAAFQRLQERGVISGPGMSYPELPGISAPGQSFPVMPGITQPQMGQQAPWMDTARNTFNHPRFNQFPGTPKQPTVQDPSTLRTAFNNVVNRFGGTNAGFVNIPQGGWQDPSLVELDEENLRDIAEIAAAIMIDMDNDLSNQMFAGLRMASEGMQKFRSQAANTYGRGIEPYLPASWSEVEKIMKDAGKEGVLPHVRFTTQWGWPEGSVKTSRLRSLQDQVNKGKISPEEALEKVAGTEFRKASPEVTEHAAGMGAGYLASAQRDIDPEAFVAKMHPFTGEFRPTDIDPNTGRAVVPSGYTDWLDEHIDTSGDFFGQFEKYQEGYAYYVRQLFGNRITDQEMEILRRMSVESMYDEMVNAAGPVSGGEQGATTLLKRGPEVVEGRWVRKKNKETGKFDRVWEESSNYKGLGYQKISAHPGADPADIGNRYMEIPDETRTAPFGRRSLKDANVLEYESITGRKPTKKEYVDLFQESPGGELTESQILRMVRAVGGTGFKENPKGGILPNMERLADYFAAGKDIPVGDMPAQDWYRAAADEALRVVGPGRYEDAMMLMELMSVTSAGTGVEKNGELALRAFAEWKFGVDDTIRNRLGLTAEQVDELLKRKGRWSDPYDIFRKQAAQSQKSGETKAFETYIKRRTEHDQMYRPIQGGPKTNNYMGSFVYKHWRDSVDRAFQDNPRLRDRIQKALDDAATIYTVDRHDSRVSNQATNVTSMGAIVNRERGILASRSAGRRGEDVQASLWYWSKDRQGFNRVNRDDDMAVALRQAWDRHVDPAKEPLIRKRILEESPDISPEDLELAADDMMRQEVFYTMVHDALKDAAPEINKKLGSKSPLKGLSELGQDTLGIINRSNNGVSSVSPGSALPKLLNTVERELKNVADGTSYGATFGFDGKDFVPEQATSGYAVALTSAGQAVSTGKRKTSAQDIQKFLSKYGDLLDEPGMVDRIKFGVFPMDEPGTASFDLSIIVPDEQTAIDIAKKHNQAAIYDIAGDRVINTGGDGTPVNVSPKDIQNTIESVFGKVGRDYRDPRDVLKYGATIEEMDRVNPMSILQRRFVRPVMEAYQEASRDRLRLAAGKTPDPLRTPGGGELVPGGFTDEDLVDFEALGQNPLISTQGNILLNERVGEDTVKDRMLNYYEQGQKDLAFLADNGFTWGADSTVDERLKAVGDSPTAKEIINRYAKRGIDPMYATPRDLANIQIQRDLADEAGIEIHRTTTWDLIRQAWGEQALFSPKYHTGNLQGAWFANALAGVFRVGSPSEFLAARKLAKGGLDEVSRKEALKSLHAYQTAQKWGFEELPHYLVRGGVSGQSGRRVSGSAVGELTARVTGSERLGRAVGRPFLANNDTSQSLEIVMRGNLWESVIDREMTKAASVIDDSINAMAAKQGIPDFEFSLIRGINTPPGGTTAAKLKQQLIELGFNNGYAERAARNYSEARNISERLAHAEVNKRQFSYDRTNLDNFVGKFIPFHYYMSRATRYYGEEVLRHPVLIYNYMKMNQGIEQAQNDPGLDARQKGFLKLMGTPLGFTLLMNPDALFGVVKVLGLQENYTPEGETKAGGVINWLKDRGLGLYPWIDGTLNLMGVYGDTFEPDMLGIRHKSLIGATVQFLRSHAGFDPAEAPYQQAMGQARWLTSSFVSGILPDWLSQPVPAKAGGSTTDATMDTIIESRILANNPQMSNQQLLDIMSDPDSPEYQAAYQEVANAGLAQQLLNFTLPQNFRVREASRDVRNAQISTIYEAAQKQGVSPTEFKPTIADMEFGTRYKNLTGDTWKPGDYNKAKFGSDLTRATPENKPFVLQQSQYDALGGPENLRIFRRYQDIRNGVDPQTAGLDDDTRKIVADTWASKRGYYDQIQYVYKLRESFELTHPEFGAFKGWQDQMYRLRNQLGGSLDEYRRQAVANNPNAARYFADVERDIRENFPEEQWQDQLDIRTTSAAAYLAITGQKTKRYDPQPTPGYPTGGDLTLATQTQPQPYRPQEDWVSALNQSNTGYGMSTYGTWWNP